MPPATRMSRTIDDPPFIRHALSGTGIYTWVWAIVRVYVGYAWLTAGWHKVTNPAWTSTGESLRGYWEKAVAIPAAPAKAAISYDWYRAFLQALLDMDAHTWFAKLIAYGELLVGIGLILGAFVGIAAFFGAVMNFNFMLAGSASTNPVLFLGAILLMLAWKNAGHWGADRWLLPWIGTPWVRRADSGTDRPRSGVHGP